MSEPLDPQLKALEQALAQLEPQARLAREEVFFRAGQASSRRGWLWPASAFVSTAAAAVFGWLLWRQLETPVAEPAPRIVIVEKFVPVFVERKSPSPAVETAPELSVSTTEPDPEAAEYLRMRREVVRWGVDALRPASPQKPAGQPLTPGAAPRLSGGIGWHGF